MSPASTLSLLKSVRGEKPRLVADEPVFGDARRVELDLDLDVLGDREKRAGDLIDENLVRLVERVDEDGVAVSGLGQLLH